MAAVLILLVLFPITSTANRSSSDEQERTPWAKESYTFDFGSRSYLKDGTTLVQSSTVYSDRTGYGLLEPAEEFVVTGRFEEPSPFVLQRKWVFDEYHDPMTMDGLRSEDGVSFRVDLPNGTYRTIVWLGDLEKGIYSMNISANDEWQVKGADAFHTVHRSMYFDFQPSQRNPDIIYTNYGMAVPYYLKVEVTDGYLVINVTGNDERYRELLEDELARDPAYSYSVWMSTGTKKYSAGTGPWRYIGGPFTNASVLGIQVYPFPDLPIDRYPERLEADRDITDDDILEGIARVNSGDLESAFVHWKSSMERELTGRNRLARSQLGMVLAGSLPLDREIEILVPVEADLLGNTDMRGDMALAELFHQVNLTNRGLKFEFERILYDEVEPKNHFIEASKAFVLLRMVPPESFLFPKVQLWAARCLMNLDPHRWTSASGTALEMMEKLRPLDPGNRYIRMYVDTTREEPPRWESPTPVISTTGEYDTWTLRDYNEGYGEAPDWASLIHEELGWLYDITDWWVDHRMQENGYLGGGWTDDVEMIGLFGFDALISEGADDKSLEGAGRFVDGMLESGQVDLELGYSRALADTEHTAELTGDSLPMMIAVDFGNPKWVEFSMKTAVLMRDLWMGENEKGWWQFRSNYLSATAVGTGGRSEDSWINFRAVLPALWSWWYSNDPEVQKLIADWADCWVRAALSTEKDKPHGVIPAGIGWPDGEIGGHDSPNWYTASHPAGSVNYDWAPQSYKSYITTLLTTAFEATRNLTFLEPLRLEAEIASDYLADPVPRPDTGSREWAGMILGQGAVSTYQSVLDKYQLPGSGPSSTLWRPHSVVESCLNGYNYIRKCYPLMTTEASATDRALFIGVANPFLVFTGGSIGGALLAPQFTYSGLERDFAAFVRDANAKTANISMYGFFEGERDASVLPWALDIGGRYLLKAGPDENGDGLMERVTNETDFTFLSRGQEVGFVLSGGREYLVSIELKEGGSGIRPLMPDPALNEEDQISVYRETGIVAVPVHNIGSDPVEDVEVAVYEDEIRIGGGTVSRLGAPTGLLPSIANGEVRIWKEPAGGPYTIVLDPDDEIHEITDRNNQLTVELDLEGIKLTEYDEPIRLIKPIPTIFAYEDEKLSHALDLTEYIHDPDNPVLDFHIDQGPVGYSSQWSASLGGLKNSTNVSFTPNLVQWKDWSGTIVFTGWARSPGPDNIFGTEDDPPELFDFEITLVVLPVNDAPSLDAIIVDGTRYNRTENGFEFELEAGEPFMGEIIWSDVDGDEVTIGLEQPSNGLVLINYTLIMGSYGSEELIATNLIITDGNGSDLQRIPLTIHIDLPSPPALLGVSFDNVNIDIPFNGEFINITVKEREERTIYFIFENAPEAYLIDLRNPGKPPGMLNVSRRSAVVLGAEVRNASEDFEFEMGWFLDNESDGYYGFKLIVTVLNVNRAPTGLDIYAEGPFYLNDEVVFTVTPAVDPDDDLLVYSIDWDDGTGPGYWTPGDELKHTFTSTGEFVVTITVEDIWGATLASSILIDVEPGEAADDDDTDDDDVQGENDDLGLVIAIIAVVVILIMIGFVIFFLRSPDREEDEEEDEEEYVHPLERA
ncbi:MAG: PKD domain-containing protein, partial [Thermoplasmatota archaeon]